VVRVRQVISAFLQVADGVILVNWFCNSAPVGSRVAWDFRSSFPKVPLLLDIIGNTAFVALMHAISMAENYFR